MKNKAKILSFLLVLITLGSLIAGCGAPADTPVQDVSVTTPLETTAPEATAEEAVQTTAPEVYKGINIDGVELDKYIIIYSKDDLFAKYAAENLSSALSSEYGVSLALRSDSSKETEHEILIGNTKRAASGLEHAPLSDGEFILCKVGSKIVCLGNNYMVGGGVGKLLSLLPATREDINITSIPAAPSPELFTPEPARSAILMIGDGMGFNAINMAFPSSEETFAAAFLPVRGEIRTASYDTLFSPATPTDSAAAGTALACGYKTFNDRVGVSRETQGILNIREIAHAVGAKTGVITTDVITGATPAAFLAHALSRSETENIQQQIDDLIDQNKVDIAKGSVGDELKSVTATSLNKLSKDGSSFFLMVEEGYIDKHSHKNTKDECISTTKRFHDCIAYVIEFVLCHPDTVLIITADHETGGIQKDANGEFYYTSTGHTVVNVPLFALGAGTEIFDGKDSDNTSIPKFLAKIYGFETFGDTKEY